MSYKDTLCTNFIVKGKQRLPYGEGDRGKFIPSEKGRRAIFVPSWGTMEIEEIDYVVEVAQGQEDERRKSKEKSVVKDNLEQVVGVAQRAKKGERANTIKEILRG